MCQMTKHFRVPPEISGQASSGESRTEAAAVSALLNRSGMSENELARFLGTSLVSVVRWVRGDTVPSAPLMELIRDSLAALELGRPLLKRDAAVSQTFASRGARKSGASLPLFDTPQQSLLSDVPGAPILERLRSGSFWSPESRLACILADNGDGSPTSPHPIAEGVSAGKNTYTYDAHTYHTKVPPQGIAEVLRRYLPEGGVVLDPFAGSGMTGVAARTLGCDVVLNELSPAASFIADRFTRSCDPADFAAAVKSVCDALAPLRRDLYTTQCRACRRDTEILYTVWSYRVSCSCCATDFVLWDHCRSYGNSVREHKILKEFPCPSCGRTLKKSQLKRTVPVPVMLGYKCCSSYQVEQPLTDKDLDRIRSIDIFPPLAEGYFPATELPDGINLRQPKKHGLTSIDRFYTSRNLAAMSHLWREIHRIEDAQVAAFVAFVLTSLYQRVTRLSEFRFWGGSGNTANFNVPYIFNEANVFATFERKARTIQDHLDTTARAYEGRCVVRTGSATDLSFLPDGSVDLVFTDPPFGANINYSEMNILWEAWLGSFTDATDEAIVSRSQGKDVARYGELMADSLRECHRVLRPGHWMLLVFMNSSQEIWQSLKDAVIVAGFVIERVDIFDKQHGTFKQFVSENTAGSDLLLHCRKELEGAPAAVSTTAVQGSIQSVAAFLDARPGAFPGLPYLHVQRDDEVDYRTLYSEFLARSLTMGGAMIDFSSFTRAVGGPYSCV